jgi:hypothetical protein
VKRRGFLVALAGALVAPRILSAAPPSSSASTGDAQLDQLLASLDETVAMLKAIPGLPPLPGLADVTLTAYCPCAICCGPWSRYGRTTAQTIPVEGFTLASRQYPIGTIVLLDGHMHQVHDRGGPKVPGFDVFHRTHAEARRFGVKRRRVQIVHIPKTQEVAR